MGSAGLLAGRTALVTGAATGIGAAIAVRLAADGAAVAINHLPTDQSAAAAAQVVHRIEASGGRALAVPADIAARDSVQAMITTITAELGAASIVVANAAVAVTSTVSWRDLSPTDWERVLEVNIVGAFNCVAAAYDGLLASGQGSVVVLSSVAPLLGRAGNLHYVTSKAAVIGFTRALAREVGPDGVRVNAVAPGAIQTPSEAAYGSEEHVSAAMLSVQALKRRGVPPDVAGVVSFLSGPDASFVTGQLLVVDGGWVMH